MNTNWIPYQPKRHREKEFYDIKLRNGDIVECCYPNGESWYPFKPGKYWDTIKDYRVVEIRLCKHPLEK